MTYIVSPARIRLNRRWFLVAGGAALAAPAISQPVLAQATEAHGFTLGEIEVLVVSDGHLTLPAGILGPSAPAEEFAALMTECTAKCLRPSPRPPTSRCCAPATTWCSSTTARGTSSSRLPGSSGEPRCGRDRARRGHPGGVHARPSGSRLGDAARRRCAGFPNAGYYVGRAESDFWTDPDLPAQIPEDLRPFAVGAQRNLGAVKERVTLVKEGDSVAPGISVIDTPGHTPGHVSLLVEGGEGLIVGADVAATRSCRCATPTGRSASMPMPSWGSPPARRCSTGRRPTGRATSASTSPIRASGGSSATAAGYHFPRPEGVPGRCGTLPLAGATHRLHRQPDGMPLPDAAADRAYRVLARKYRPRPSPT